MALKSVTLQLPEELYRAMRQAAEASHRSIEAVLLESAEKFWDDLTSTDIDTLLEQMSSYSDAQLWTVVYRRLTDEQSRLLSSLSDKNKRGELTTSEQTELEQLLGLVNRHMLLRSQALLLLQQRGRDVETYLKTGV